jgi:tetratricopeptide (TPR) repeat protein
MIVHGILGRVAWCQGDFAATERHQRLAVNLAMELGDRLGLGHALVDWANTLLYMGPEKAEEALGRYNRAVAIFTEIREDTALSRALMDRAILFHNLGRMDEAFRDLRGAIQASERGGSYVYQVYSYLNEAQFRTEVHDLANVRELLEKSRALNDRLGDPLVPQQIAMIEGMLAEEECDWPAARAAYERALEMTRKLEMLPDLVEMHVRLARLGWKSGDLDFGRGHLEEALRRKVLEVRGDLAASVEEVRRGLEASSAGAPRESRAASG